jgi:hypothetical protein
MDFLTGVSRRERTNVANGQSRVSAEILIAKKVSPDPWRRRTVTRIDSHRKGVTHMKVAELCRAHLDCCCGDGPGTAADCESDRGWSLCTSSFSLTKAGSRRETMKNRMRSSNESRIDVSCTRTEEVLVSVSLRCGCAQFFVDPLSPCLSLSLSL